MIAFLIGLAAGAVTALALRQAWADRPRRCETCGTVASPASDCFVRWRTSPQVPWHCFCSPVCAKVYAVASLEPDRED